MKGSFLAVIFGLLINLSAGASTVSFYVVETGLNPNADNFIGHAAVWEDAFFDVFFEAGHIVSNAPILRLERKPANNILSSVDFNIVDARDGGTEYVVITFLDYTPDLLTPGEITFYIYRVVPRTLILERVIPGRTYRTSREELDDVKSMARGLIPYIGD